MLEKINHSSQILLEDFPTQWISKVELYYPDLPGFPIVYVHRRVGSDRIYGFPLSVCYKDKSKSSCDLEIKFLCNKDLEKNLKLKDLVTEELKERFGISKKFGQKEVIESCNSNPIYERFFKELMKFTLPLHGESIPYGAFYEEMYSIVRFVSAFQPKTGRQSEMRMLYNFLSIFGEKIEMKEEWKYIEFYLIPTYDDLITENLNAFNEFKILLSVMKIIWSKYYKVPKEINGTVLKFMDSGWPMNKELFITEVTSKMRKEGSITSDEMERLERLVDAFNRHPRRTAYFIWSIMTAFDKDYRTWDKEFYKKSILLKNTIGYSPKVLSCFLQQGFKKEEIIPFDTWIKSFHKLALGIEDKKDFIDGFSKIGKLERLIWLACQAKKINNRHLIDTLWCIRFGVRGNKELRGPNPIACYECRLRKDCPSYGKIKNDKVLLVEMNAQSNTTKRDLSELSDCKFICKTYGGTPKKIMRIRGKKNRSVLKQDDEFPGYILVDEFSGYILGEKHKINNQRKIMLVDEIIASLPKFEGADFRKTIVDNKVDDFKSEETS